MRSVFLLQVLCLTLAASERTLTSVTTSSQNTNVSISFVPAGGKGSAPLPLNDSRIAPTGGAEQVHLTYVNSTSVVVSWATGNGTSVNGPLSAVNVNNTYGPLSTVNVTPDTNKYPVSYGTAAAALSKTAYGEERTYTQIYTGFVNDTLFSNSNPIQNYTSPLLHHVELTGLKPNTTYFYAVSAGNGVNSSTYNFTTPPAAGSYPLTMGVFADVGQTFNSSETMRRLLDQSPDVLAFVGDWSYADDYLTTGEPIVIGFPNNTFTGNNISSPSGTFQTRWDTWGRLAAPLLSHIPIIPNAGNHELEPQGNGRYFQTSQWGLDSGRQFNAYLARFPVGPLSFQSGGAPLYYSTEVGPVHYITLNNYENFLVGSPQFIWLQNNLKTVDRALTPWIVINWHAPWYSSYTTHYKETESMRVTMEPLFYAAGVDIVLNGHLHEYERTHAVYNYTVNDCGTVHIIAGDGGNIEGLYTTYIDQNGTANCPAPGAKALPNYQPGPYTPSFTYNLTNAYDGYCPSPSEGQPKWSAFRQPAFGHGLLTFINETVAHWQWNRNIDASETDYPDDVYIIRDRTCFNQGGNGPALAPLLSPSAADYINQTHPILPQIPTASLYAAALGTPPGNRVTQTQAKSPTAAAASPTAAAKAPTVAAASIIG